MLANSEYQVENSLFILHLDKDEKLCKIIFKLEALYRQFKLFLKKCSVPEITHYEMPLSLDEYLQVSWIDRTRTVSSFKDLKIVFDKFSFELNLDRPEQLKSDISHSKCCPVFFLTAKVEAIIPEDLLSEMHSSEIRKFAFLVAQDRRTSVTSFFSKLSSDALSLIVERLDPNLTFHQARTILEFELMKADDQYLKHHDKDTSSFRYDDEKIGFSQELGTHVTIFPNKNFILWFTTLPLQITLKVTGYEIFKPHENAVAINLGLRTCGIQIKMHEGRYLVCNNLEADRLANQKEVLKASLKILSKVLKQGYLNRELINAAFALDFKGVQKALIEGADPDTFLALKDSSGKSYPTLLHYLRNYCLEEEKNFTPEESNQKGNIKRKIILELIYWGADLNISDGSFFSGTANSFCSAEIKQVKAVQELVNEVIKKSYVRYFTDLHSIQLDLIDSLMKKYVKSVWRFDPYLEEAKKFNYEKCCIWSPNGIYQGSYEDRIIYIKSLLASSRLNSSSSFHALLEFVMDEIKFTAFLNAHALVHEKESASNKVLPFPKAKWTSEGMRCFSEGMYESEQESNDTIRTPTSLSN